MKEMTVGERIQQLRKAAGLSQEQLAEQLDVSRQSVSKWELNDAAPEISKIIALSELFGGGALPFFALACAASYLLSGYSSLYGSQRIVLDKWHIGE